MPKKTKKDKIMAKLRRSSSSRTATHHTEEMTSVTTSTYSFISSSEKKMQQTLSEYAVELKTIKSDLYKTIFLAIIAFSVEIYLYWLLQR